jgi:hypothetical protein
VTTHTIPVKVGNHTVTVEMRQVYTEPVEGPKRLRLPYELRWACPNCGHDQTDDLGDGERFGYKMLPGEYTEGFYCPECDFEFKIKVKLDVTLEIVDDK